MQRVRSGAVYYFLSVDAYVHTDWLKDKECFALAALYQPLSKIPLEIWRAGKSNTNGVEQKHRDVNRDGVGLTLLGGVWRGMQHDIREDKHIALVVEEDIHRRYRPSVPAFREIRSVQGAGALRGMGCYVMLTSLRVHSPTREEAGSR